MIDSHVHIWDARRFAISWLTRRPELRQRYDVDDLMREAGGSAPDQVVLVQVGDDPRALHWLLRGAEHSPRAGGVIGTHRLGRSAAGLGMGRRINMARASPGGEYLRGFRLIGRGEGDDYFERPDIRDVLAVLDEHELAANLLVTPRQLTGVARAAEHRRHPVVVDHLGSPPLSCPDWGRNGASAEARAGDTARSSISTWQDGISAVAGVDGVVLKLSGAALVSPSHVGHAETAAALAWQALGPGRFMFGSDWPMSSPMTYAHVTSRVREILRRIGADPGAQGVWSSVAQRVFRLRSSRDVTFNHSAASTQKGHTA